MKIILVVLAIWALWWLLRRSFGGIARPPSAAASSAAPQLMMACAYCGVHLPGADSLPGRGGVFCGEAHRAAFEKAHATP